MSKIKEQNAKALESVVAPIKYEVDGQEITLTPSIVKEYIAGGQNITNAEYKMFVELCKVRKLNPFLKEVYLIKYGNAPAQIVVGKDAIVKRAVKNAEFNGREQGVIVLDKNEEIAYRKGALVLDGETLLGGWARVHRKGWDYPVETAVTLREATQRKSDGKPNTNWATRPATMVEKVALMRALREAFVEDFGGMIDEDEVWTDTEELNVVEQGDPTEVDEHTGEIIEVEIGDTQKEPSLKDI